MQEITGKTSVLCILADPIHHVRTPQLVNRLLAAQAVDGVMVPVHVSPAHLALVVEGLRNTRNLMGMVVTVPHKISMLSMCDEVVGDALSIGAVNVVRREPDGRLVGAMLDGHGFVRGLAALGVDVAGASVYMAGAGGAACAIAFALAQSGAASLTIANRSRSRIDELSRRLGRFYPDVIVRTGTADASGHAIVVNATSLGMAADDALPLDVHSLDASQVVADIIMDPAQTALLREAQARGCRIYGGAGMLSSQVDDMVSFFRRQG